PGRLTAAVGGVHGQRAPQLSDVAFEKNVAGGQGRVLGDGAPELAVGGVGLDAADRAARHLIR
ncbi:MAG: hypothetical protein AAF220_11060, partial [Pseudomonadota bacterium]